MPATLKYAVIPVTPFEQNCSLVWTDDTKEAAVIDPGGDIDLIQQVAAEQGVKIVKIWITHGHLDHAAGAAELAEKLKVPIEGPQEDETFWIEKIPAQAANYGFPPARSFSPDRWLHDGDKVEIGGVEFDVVHCPGHTPGHVVFVQPQARIAFVGDVLFQGSVGRTDFPRGSFPDLLHSIRDKLFPLGDDIAFVSGHGPMSTFGRERRSNPFVGDGAV